MPTTKIHHQINNNGVNISVDDYGGEGPIVILIHGWPLSGRSWKKQINPLLENDFRVITYDRRGFGDSDKSSNVYNYDVFAEDLYKIVEQLNLKDISLVGFSMGGGEVARYLSTYGEDNIHSVVFASAVPPYLAKTDDNPQGPLDEETAKTMRDGVEGNPSEFYSTFLKQFFSANGDGNVLVSDEQMAETFDLANHADKQAALASMEAFGTTDFREDLKNISVPTLVIHGDADGIVDFEGSGKLTHEQIKQSQLHVVSGGPHGINVSHADEFNNTLISFLKEN